MRTGELDATDFTAASVACPLRPLIEYFDVLILCCGSNPTLLDAMISQGLRCGPKIDILAHKFWDLTQAPVFSWIFFLLRHKRVRYFHSSLPVLTRPAGAVGTLDVQGSRNMFLLKIVLWSLTVRTLRTNLV